MLHSPPSFSFNPEHRVSQVLNKLDCVLNSVKVGISTTWHVVSHFSDILLFCVRTSELINDFSAGYRFVYSLFGLYFGIRRLNVKTHLPKHHLEPFGIYYAHRRVISW